MQVADDASSYINSFLSDESADIDMPKSIIQVYNTTRADNT